MSFYKTLHRCQTCKGYIEIWEHNESGEKSFQKLPKNYFHNTPLFATTCMCTNPAVDEINK